MDTSETSTAWQPLSGGERYAALDVLRGVALLGVLLINLEMCFRNSFAAYVLEDRNFTGPTDHVVAAILTTVLQLKALTLFSFSFGLGMAVQAERAKPRGVGFRWFLIRRLGVLLGLGLCHMFLIWNGDILVLYSLCGLLLVPLLRLPSIVQALLGIAAIALNFVIPTGHLFPTYEQYETLATQTAQTHATGNYVKIMLLHWWEAVHLTAPCLLAVFPRTFGLMLLGVAAWRSGLLREPERHRLLLGCGALLGGTVGGTATALIEFWPSIIKQSRIPTEVFQAVSFIPLALAFAAALFLCLGSARATFFARPLAAVGQMALTNYLSQSVILGFVFFGYGLGQQGKLGTTAGALIGISLYVAQVPLSLLWLSQFQFGPAEWLWRSLTYGRWQPILRVKSFEAST